MFNCPVCGSKMSVIGLENLEAEIVNKLLSVAGRDLYITQGGGWCMSYNTDGDKRFINISQDVINSLIKKGLIEDAAPGTKASCQIYKLKEDKKNESIECD